ncbi:uncharacterized protein E0L32_010086 [Thyridium curvatum]|uniref:Carbohydrate kinase PfkB domain-containing protein n=1 Tax=Thyridium curvatum TaxID=1093900 RepID=A0A507AU74_9PEZI|nr:uncharacterized protein E0L32_010086 [Thyridium curvatum]TPX08469.1 hypothetical protein E0L32_010086 [Thyridium curvatum]
MAVDNEAVSDGVSDQNDAQVSEDQVLDFFTFGMFIIDEIEYPSPKPPVKDILGGAGAFSALGARLFSPPPTSRSVGWIVDRGSDFPEHLTAVIDGWDTAVLFRDDGDRLTTRGWNGYEDAASERRSFRYTTPRKRLHAEDLTPALLSARAFHVISSPSRCRDIVGDLLSRRRRSMGDAYCRPYIVWEPVPDACTPDELLSCTNTLPVVDVCSPNHAELAGLMGDPDRGLDPQTGEVSAAAVERSCEQLLASMPLQSFTLVVRAGDKGCYLAKNGGRKRATTTAAAPAAKRSNRKKEYTRGGLQPDTDMEALFAGLMQDEDGLIAREEIEVDPGLEKWIPAYHAKKTQQGEGDDDADDAGPEVVVDPTGGGNTFMGGLAVALARGKCVEEAAVWGSVAASFAIEQVGVPTLGHDDDGNELWNGVKVDDRLRELQDRLAKV